MPSSHFPGLELLQWTGTDGVVWDWLDPMKPVHLKPGCTFFSPAPADAQTIDATGVDGTRAVSIRLPGRHHVAKVAVTGKTSEEFRANDAAFWAGMNPFKTGTLTVRAPGSNTRRITLRPGQTSETSVDKEPHLIGRCEYVLDLHQDDPMWEADTAITTPFGILASPPWHPTPGAEWGNIAETTTTGTITNTGQAEAWPVWTITGPVLAGSPITVSIDGQTTTVNKTLTDGQTLILDMRPTSTIGQNVRLGDGTSLMNTGVVTTWAPAPVKPGGTSTITASAGIFAGILAQIRPRYFKAW